MSHGFPTAEVTLAVKRNRLNSLRVGTVSVLQTKVRVLFTTAELTMCVSQGHVFLFDIILSVQGFPNGSNGKKKNLPAMWEIQVQSLGGEDLTPVFLPGEFHGQRNLVGYSPWGHKESDITEGLTLSHLCSRGSAGTSQVGLRLERPGLA